MAMVARASRMSRGVAPHLGGHQLMGTHPMRVARRRRIPNCLVDRITSEPMSAA